MKVIVLADEVNKEEFMMKKINDDVQLIFIEEFAEVRDHTSADAFFIIKEGIDTKSNTFFGDKPVFINSAIKTLSELKLPENFSRINGWPGFLDREIWEIASGKETAVKDIFEKLGWQYILVADTPGLVSARIISMIINEAYFALGDNVSTKEEIDIAMKLGTNYPYGPFEWSRKIGPEKVYNLLEKLNQQDNRYTIAPAMKNDLLN